MDILQRLQLKTGETDIILLMDLIESAKQIYLSYRFPWGEYPTREVVETITTTDELTGETVENTVTTQETYVEDRYLDWQYRCALDLYNKQGAEGEINHSENGIGRTFESSWVSAELLREIVPYAGVIR